MKITCTRVCMKLNTLTLSFAPLISDNLERGQRSWAQWHAPIIPAWETETGGLPGLFQHQQGAGRDDTRKAFHRVQGLLCFSALQFSKHHQRTRTELEKTPCTATGSGHKPCAVGRRPSLCAQSISRNPCSLMDKSGWCCMLPGDCRCAPAGSTH